MSSYVVDTNVPIVANGLSDDGRPHSIDCREASVLFLKELLSRHIILVDEDKEIESEYQRYLQPKGQPGVGDRFYREVINSHPDRILRIKLNKNAQGEFVDVPQDIINAGFDRSDWKFLALAINQNSPVANSVDSDWLIHRGLLEANDVSIKFLCGCDQSAWYSP